MALIIEDGTGVTDANSYITATEAKAYATDRGYPLPAADADVEKLILRAMDYVEVQPFIGSKTNDDQALQWPRKDTAYPDDGIPLILKQAVSRLTYDVSVVGDLLPTTSGGAVLREKVGPIETEFATSTVTNTPAARTAIYMLASLLTGAGAGLRSVRV